jgi:hypothetical protein
LTWRHRAAATPHHKEEVICVVPVALGIVVIGAVLLSSAAAGTLAAVVIHRRRRAGHGLSTRNRQSWSTGIASGVPLAASGTVLTARASSLALAGAPGEGPAIQVGTALAQAWFVSQARPPE